MIDSKGGATAKIEIIARALALAAYDGRNPSSGRDHNDEGFRSKAVEIEWRHYRDDAEKLAKTLGL